MPLPAFLTRIFSGKAKEIASTVVNGLDNLFTSKEEKLAKQIEIEKLVNEHIEKMESLAIEETKAYLADTANARDNNTKIQESDKASWMAKNIAYCIDAVFILAFILMLILILKKQVPESNKELFYTGFGLLGGYVGTIINFHRGTSIGSERKQKQIEKMTEGK